MGVLAAIVETAIWFTRRSRPMVLYRGAGGAGGFLVAAVGIVVGKEADLISVILPWSYKVIGAGVFVPSAVLFLPSILGKNSAAPDVTLQQRAARPANATVRLREQGADNGSTSAGDPAGDPDTT